MTNYYFVGILLPSLQLDAPSENISFREFSRLLHDNLAPLDLNLSAILCRYYDIENIRKLWLHETLSPYGNLDEAGLNEAITNFESLPDYVLDYLERYETKEARLHFFPALFAAYYREEGKSANGFIREYLKFERELRLIQTAFRAKKLKRDLAKELQYEEADEELIKQLLAQKDAATFEVPDDFQELKNLLAYHYEIPIDLYKALLQYRFNKIELLAGDNPFSIKRILATGLQLILVESYQKLDAHEGIKWVDNYIKEQA